MAPPIRNLTTLKLSLSKNRGRKAAEHGIGNANIDHNMSIQSIIADGLSKHSSLNKPHGSQHLVFVGFR